MANTANQMTLQRYFSTASMKAAKRSFITSTTVNVILVALLTIIGASLIYYFTEGPEALPHSIDLSSGKDRDSIFPLFVAAHLPPGLAGPFSPRFWQRPCLPSTRGSTRSQLWQQ